MKKIGTRKKARTAPSSSEQQTDFAQLARIIPDERPKEEKAQPPAPSPADQQPQARGEALGITRLVMDTIGVALTLMKLSPLTPEQDELLRKPALEIEEKEAPQKVREIAEKVGPYWALGIAVVLIFMAKTAEYKENRVKAQQPPAPSPADQQPQGGESGITIAA